MTVGIGGVVLAAGTSSRAGMFKMNCVIEGKTVIERCIEGMASVCSEIIVVGGYRIGLLGYLPGRYHHLKLINNADFNQGMFSSVKKGLLASTSERVFITPGDCPLIEPVVYGRMLESAEDIIVPAYGGREGHPVLMNRAAAAALLSGNYESLREFIASYGYVTVDADDAGILIDLDTPYDYRTILHFLREKEAAALGTHHNGPD